MTNPVVKDILARSTVGGISNVYILGNNAKRVTFYSQQRRAFNLIWSLFEDGRLHAGDRIAIIGGGLAGMTAAVAAKAKGCKPTIYEQGQTLLPLWSANRHRYVHPNIYDWPNPGSDIQLTHLPALNWRASIAKEVAEQVMHEWELYKDGITEELPSIVSMLAEKNGKVTVTSDPFALETFECAILAVGFGLEETHNILNAATYWEGDGLDLAPNTIVQTKKKVLITGCGDGGMIDALRLSLINFDHQDFSEIFLQHPSFDAIKSAILDAEKKFEIMDADAASSEIYTTYKALASADLQKALQDRLRKDTEVWLNADSATPLNKQSSVHNRVLVSLLIGLKVIHFIPGKALTYEQQADGSCIVTIKKPNGVKEKRTVNKVIVRHGPKEILTGLLGPKCTIPKNSTPDPTSQQLWPNDFYAELPTPTPNQKKFMNDNIGSLYERIGSSQYDEAVGITVRDNQPHYLITFLQQAPQNYLTDLEQHKGYPIILERRKEAVIAQNAGHELWRNFREPRLIVGAPIANKMNHSYGKLSFGTLGCFVLNAHGQLGCISTSHVLTSRDYINVTDIDILYESNLTRFLKSETIGRVRNIVPIKYQGLDSERRLYTETLNQMDAGLVIIESSLPKPSLREAMKIIRMDDIFFGQRVKKSGAGSGETNGRVTAVACRITVTFDEKTAIFNNVFEVKGLSKSFSTVGDSGALVMTERNEAMGIIFAGNDEVTYVCPIEPILKFFRCRLMTVD